jgi:hypothetical protein
VGPQNPKDLTRDTAGDLSALVGELAALKGDATHWLTDPDYAALRYWLEAAHAAAEAALVVQRSTYQRSLIGCLDCETREEALARRVTTAFRWAHASWDNALPSVPGEDRDRRQTGSGDSALGARGPRGGEVS